MAKQLLYQYQNGCYTELVELPDSESNDELFIRLGYETARFAHFEAGLYVTINLYARDERRAFEPPEYLAEIEIGESWNIVLIWRFPDLLAFLNTFSQFGQFSLGSDAFAEQESLKRYPKASSK